ncbi:MAG: hypothetical protein QXK37_02510 [Candidatus Woesearchaeota archaeon]
MEQLTSNPYIVPECAYAVDANTLFERSLLVILIYNSIRIIFITLIYGTCNIMNPGFEHRVLI